MNERRKEKTRTGRMRDKLAAPPLTSTVNSPVSLSNADNHPNHGGLYLNLPLFSFFLSYDCLKTCENEACPSGGTIVVVVFVAIIKELTEELDEQESMTRAGK